ncbi:MAG: HD domain-containing protein [Deltaproteobacteria bacterium]|nr:HD domain-containing protein [Deltaproteobacteria bacterium]
MNIYTHQKRGDHLKTKNIYIRDIKAGEKISTGFLLTEKNLAFSQKGAPYLNLRLKDKTGEVDGKVWENALEFNDVCKKGDIIQITARAVSYKSALQLSVLAMKQANPEEIDPADYFPSSKYDIETMYAEILEFVDKMESPCLKELVSAFLQNDETAALFKQAPAAKGFHHVYIGGLLEHTLSVTRLLKFAAGHYQGVNHDLLIAGGILHDIGKIHELSFDGVYDYTDEGRLIGHIIIGMEMVNAGIAAIKDFPEQTAMELRHLILSHHGELEFGSPKRPKTLEALIVHHIDDMDAKVNAFQEYAPAGDSEWTPFHRLLERFIYKGVKS